MTLLRQFLSITFEKISGEKDYCGSWPLIAASTAAMFPVAIASRSNVGIAVMIVIAALIGSIKRQ